MREVRFIARRTRRNSPIQVSRLIAQDFDFFGIAEGVVADDPDSPSVLPAIVLDYQPAGEDCGNELASGSARPSGSASTARANCASRSCSMHTKEA